MSTPPRPTGAPPPVLCRDATRGRGQARATCQVVQQRGTARACGWPPGCCEGSADLDREADRASTMRSCGLETRSVQRLRALRTFLPWLPSRARPSGPPSACHFVHALLGGQELVEPPGRHRASAARRTPPSEVAAEAAAHAVDVQQRQARCPPGDLDRDGTRRLPAGPVSTARRRSFLPALATRLRARRAFFHLPALLTLRPLTVQVLVSSVTEP